MWHCREGEGGQGGRKVFEGESLGETRAGKHFFVSVSRTDPKERQPHGSIFCYFGGFFFGGLSYEIFLITAGRCLYYWAFFVLRVCPFMRCWAAFVLFSVFCFKGVPFHALLSSKGAQLPISNLGLRWAIQGLELARRRE